jgi:serine/alanine adding enzyme
METRVAEERDWMQWNDYVKHHSQGWIYHLFEWRKIFYTTYGHTPIYLLAEQKKNIVGVLPIIMIDSFIGRRVMVSMPYFGFGGIIADNVDVLSCLVESAKKIGKQYRAKNLELRQLGDSFTSLPRRIDKVLMSLDLATTPEEQMRGLKPKVRNEVRKANKSNLINKIGKDSKSFYRVYSENMRRLGVPCHSEELFSTILDTFPENTFTVNIFKGDVPVASAIALSFKGTIEIPCAASLREAKRWPNVMLYWSLIEYGCNRGFKRFSFGRSSIGSGTYQFKKGWGAKPIELPYCYVYLNAKPNRSIIKGDNRMFSAWTIGKNIWRKLPLSVTSYLGPRILRQLTPIL